MGRQMRDRRNHGPVTVATQEVWAGQVFAMRTDQVQLTADSEPVTRDYVDHPGAVGIVAVEPRRNSSGELVPHVLLVSQYRHPVRADLWEIPAGLLDVPGEDPVTAAKRELGEEVDLAADTWHVLVDIFTSPGATNESLRVFLAEGLSPTGTIHERLEEEAFMEAIWVPLEEAVAGAFSGDLHNPSAVVGILAAWGALQDRKLLRNADAPWFR